jgi:hypothetical protein
MVSTLSKSDSANAPKQWDEALLLLIWKAKWRQFYLILGFTVFLCSILWNFLPSRHQELLFDAIFGLGNSTLDLRGFASDLESLFTTHAFTLIETNLNTLMSEQSELEDLIVEQELLTFNNIAPLLSDEEIAQRISFAMSDRNRILDHLMAVERDTVSAVNDAIDSKTILEAVDPPQPDDRIDVEKTLRRIDERRALWDSSIHELLDPDDEPPDSTTVQRSMADLLGALGGSPDISDRSHRVLTLQAAFAERLSLVEMRSYLQELHRAKNYYLRETWS